MPITACAIVPLYPKELTPPLLLSAANAPSPAARSCGPSEPTPLRFEMPRFRDQFPGFFDLGLAALSYFAIGRAHLHDGRLDGKRVLDRTCRISDGELSLAPTKHRTRVGRRRGLKCGRAVALRSVVELTRLRCSVLSRQRHIARRSV